MTCLEVSALLTVMAVVGFALRSITRQKTFEISGADLIQALKAQEKADK